MIIFYIFKILLKFEHTSLDSSHVMYYCEYFHLLGNDVEFLQFQPDFFNIINIENIVDHFM